MPWGVPLDPSKPCAALEQALAAKVEALPIEDDSLLLVHGCTDSDVQEVLVRAFVEAGYPGRNVLIAFPGDEMSIEVHGRDAAAAWLKEAGLG